jgi:hypothetical protein
MAASLRFMATGEAQLLARLPPLKKMGPVKHLRSIFQDRFFPDLVFQYFLREKIQVFHLSSAFNPLHRSSSHETKLATLSDEQVKESILNDLFHVSKRAKFRTIM